MTDPARRDALVKAKLRALVRTRWAAAEGHAREGSVPGGAALVEGDTAWVLAENDASRSLGPALAWARKAGATALHLLATADTGVLARRAASFALDVHVWRVDGTTLAEAVAEPLPDEPQADPASEAFRGLLERAGTDPIVEHGILRGEVLGLEVARVVPGDDGEGLRLEVGVGRHDRDMHRETSGLHHGMDELFEVVRIVAEHRRPGGDGEAYHLAPERWLRAIVVRRPDLVGASRLEPVPSPVVRTDLRRAAPAPAAGEDASGRPVLVVCSAGLDLDVMSAAADAWLAFEPRGVDGVRLVLCLPAPDAYPAVRDLASLHVPAADVVTVPAEWRSL